MHLLHCVWTSENIWTSRDCLDCYGFINLGWLVLGNDSLPRMWNVSHSVPEIYFFFFLTPDRPHLMDIGSQCIHMCLYITIYKHIIYHIISYHIISYHIISYTTCRHIRPEHTLRLCFFLSPLQLEGAASHHFDLGNAIKESTWSLDSDVAGTASWGFVRVFFTFARK